MESQAPKDNIQEKSSLKLLQSIIDVGLHPENFSDVCKAWVEHSEDKEALQNFESLLNTVYIQNSKYFENSTLTPSGTPEDSHSTIEDYSFVLNTHLDVISLGNEVALLLNLSIGHKADHIFETNPQKIFETTHESDGKVSFGDVIGSEGKRHLASIARVSTDTQATTLFKFTLWKIDLSKQVENYIRDNLHLTNTEIEILKLCLQRQSIHEISETRGSSLNTIRTHIKNIKNKYRSHSLTDVISSTHEIIAIHHTELSGSTSFKNKYIPRQPNVTLAQLPATPYKVEYSRYGDPANTPLILLHSIEYGVLPPKAFLELAHSNGYCLYAVVRPGFGRTTPTASIVESAKVLNRFFDTLDLKDITLIALSTSAPTALELLSLNPDIKEALFVNYAFDTKNKIQHIKPVWLRGLLEFGLGSQESFKFAFRMSKGMLKVIGAETFYKKMYQSCEEDLLFLATNQETFEASANLILSAEPNTCRHDLSASFLENPQVDTLVAPEKNITSIFGEYTHGISLTPIRNKAKALGIPFHVIEGTGRNCIYQKPEVFFDIVELSAKTKVAQ